MPGFIPKAPKTRPAITPLAAHVLVQLSTVKSLHANLIDEAFDILVSESSRTIRDAVPLYRGQSPTKTIGLQLQWEKVFTVSRWINENTALKNVSADTVQDMHTQFTTSLISFWAENERRRKWNLDTTHLLLPQSRSSLVALQVSYAQLIQSR